LSVPRLQVLPVGHWAPAPVQVAAQTFGVPGRQPVSYTTPEKTWPQSFEVAQVSRQRLVALLAAG
jgi:hypothetical protein